MNRLILICAAMLALLAPAVLAHTAHDIGLSPLVPKASALGLAEAPPVAAATDLAPSEYFTDWCLATASVTVTLGTPWCDETGWHVQVTESWSGEVNKGCTPTAEPIEVPVTPAEFSGSHTIRAASTVGLIWPQHPAPGHAITPPNPQFSDSWSSTGYRSWTGAEASSASWEEFGQVLLETYDAEADSEAGKLKDAHCS